MDTLDKESTSKKTLREKVLSGFKWLAIGKFAGQLINWGITFVVIRLLEPADYGLMSMGSMFIAFISIMNEMGLGASIVQNKNMDITTLRQIFGIIIIVNFVLYILLYICSPVISLFFNEQKLVLIVRVLALQFIVMSFLIVPQAIMDRNMNFKRRAIGDLVANLAGGVLTLILAWKAWGVWALVWGCLFVLLIRTIVYNICQPFLFLPLFSLSGMKQILKFGGYITIEKLLWSLYSKADMLIIGKLLGKEALGFYSIGKEVASLPMQKIMPIINQIAFPAFARIQDDNNLFRNSTYKAIALISIISFPTFIGISSVAEEIVSVVLGPMWIAASTPLMLISLALPLRMTTGVIVSLLKSKGRADISLYNNLMTAVLMVLGFSFGINWGVTGISLVWPTIYPVCFLLIFINSSKYVGVKTEKILAVMAFPFATAIIMFFCVKLIRILIGHSPDSIFQLCSMVAVGAFVYLLLQLSFYKKTLNFIP